MGVAQNQSAGVTQVLVHVSTYQGSILAPHKVQFVRLMPLRRHGLFRTHLQKHDVCVHVSTYALVESWKSCFSLEVLCPVLVW